MQISRSYEDYKKSLKDHIWEISDDNNIPTYAKSPSHVIIKCEKEETKTYQIQSPIYNHTKSTLEWEIIEKISIYTNNKRSDIAIEKNFPQNIQNTESYKKISIIYKIIKRNEKISVLKIWLFLQKVMSDKDFVKSILLYLEIIKTISIENEKTPTTIFDIKENKFLQEEPEQNSPLKNIFEGNENRVFMALVNIIDNIQKEKNNNNKFLDEKLENNIIAEKKYITINILYFQYLYCYLNNQEEDCPREKCELGAFEEIVNYGKREIILWNGEKKEKLSAHNTMEIYEIYTNKDFHKNLQKYNKEFENLIVNDITLLNQDSKAINDLIKILNTKQ